MLQSMLADVLVEHRMDLGQIKANAFANAVARAISTGRHPSAVPTSTKVPTLPQANIAAIDWAARRLPPVIPGANFFNDA